MRVALYPTRGIALFSNRCRASRLVVACFQRASHSTFSSNCTDETVSLPIGNNGSISLRITRPSALSKPDHGLSEKPNVILYLPPGPLFRGSDLRITQHDVSLMPYADGRAIGELGSLTSTGESPQHLLASTASAIVVTVNYRLGEMRKRSQSHRKIDPGSQESDDVSDQVTNSSSSEPHSYKYPTPVHDTLAGFDWIQTNLQPAQLAVFGTHIGGSLALMLALTEARCIKSVGALDPVCDWPSLDEYCVRENANINTNADTAESTETIPKPKRQRRKAAPRDLVPLLEARSRFFATPERCFDSFASPILFLRSAGRDVPRAFPQYLTGPEYPVPVLQYTPTTTETASDGLIWDQDEYPDADGEEVDELAATATRRRKALSRWPPYGLDYGLSGDTWSGPDEGIGRLELTLPWVRVFASGYGNVSAVEREPSVKPVTRAKESGTGSTVLARQADEMVSAMRRACFWGREKGFAERKVNLSKVDGFDNVEAGKWFDDVFKGTMEEVD
ncbi:uncharacterized protein N7506_000554 [Penicillium brevicompactum]|uniref:uncharacterized protein n=1 Tax=Penicillium brevicompactum TaxID=5074 RepID=UPI002541675F|nr:uncharacterized protein N7506_000554 [Penicillium brevicompactum]KAJ5347301.1 hypothetical protein N7506_000554 [Penicillium brevicompactum]